MWTFVVAAQMAVQLAAQSAVASADSIYATPALRAVVALAADHNRRPPPTLQSYRARIESELAALVRRADGTEGTIEIEQVASDARWRRSGTYEQHIIGYRAQLAALAPSLVGLVRQSWTVPVLYGNRLSLLFGVDTSRAARSRDSTIVVMHPLAEDRERIYRYTGGDTVATLRVPGAARAIPLVRVHVEPSAHLRTRALVFRGDLYLDATTDQLVRMRGVFALVDGHRGLRAVVLQSVFVIDLTNAEIDGAYWLPADQRIEAQVASPFAGTGRIVVRVRSHYSRYVVNDTGVGPMVGDTLMWGPHPVTYAPSDSVTRYGGWTLPLGAATTAVRAADYDDLAPDYWRPTGRPRLDWRVDRFSDFLRVDRVEGLYTGYGAALRFRDAAPGLVAHGNVGYAWTERTMRGAVGLDWTRPDASLVAGVRVERALDNTNDFRTSFADGPTIEALVAQDDYDYVDRRRATVFAERAWGASRDVVARVEAGAGDDRGEARRVLRPPIFPWVFVGDSTFRVNRGVLPGGYGRVAVTVALHPDVDAGYATPGFGVRLRDEWAGGDLSWNRAEARIVERQPVGPFTLLGRGDAGIVTGTVIPPQQLFELGFDEGLTSYNYKQFAGDRAALLQGEIQYALPIRALSRPIRLPGGFFLPGPAPALAAGVQSGWTEVGTAAAARAVAQLNAPSAPTHGLRSSIDLLVRAFGGAVGVGAARAVGDAAGAVHGRNWTAFVALGAAF
ncbi:MAG TPA: hypothetical protein VNW46_11970 [Gemmatimonadaceae bacterium]|nr:hypothetical protein [Gemmatimonadaceae bacterium]